MKQFYFIVKVCVTIFVRWLLIVWCYIRILYIPRDFITIIMKPESSEDLPFKVQNESTKQIFFYVPTQKYLLCKRFFTILVSHVEIFHRKIKIRQKLLASTFIVRPHAKWLNVGCIMHFDFGKFWTNSLWNAFVWLWNTFVKLLHYVMKCNINFGNTLFGPLRYNICEFASRNVAQNIYCWSFI